MSRVTWILQNFPPSTIMIYMHILQEKLLKLAQERNLGQLTLREVGSLVGERSPQKIKHHLQQLEKRGLIRVNKIKGLIEKTQQGWVKGLLRKARLLVIPILGTANAGPARIFTERNIQGYLRVSSTILKQRGAHKLFAVRVDGPSMNRVEIDGKRIEDGDYIIVDSKDREPRNGDVVLSVIDGMANVKKYYWDKENKQIVLMSDSTHDFPPIYIHQSDDYMLNGKVIQVIKKPNVK